jgi:hypothetical protein
MTKIPKRFLKSLQDEIQMLLIKKKRSPLNLKGQVAISKNLYKNFENNIRKKFSKDLNDYNFLIENNISSNRYFHNDGYNSIIINSN